MRTKYNSFNAFMKEVTEDANKLVGNIDSFFAIDSKTFIKLVDYYDLNKNEIKHIYQKIEVPQTVIKVGEKLLPEWKKVRDDKTKIDALLQIAVPYLIKKVAHKQIQLLDKDYLLQLEYDRDLEKEVSEIEDLLLYFKDIYHDLNKYDLKTNVKRKTISLLNKTKDCLIANPKDYHGKGIVTPDLNDQTRHTAAIVTVSNFINVFFSSPLLFYAFSFLGTGFAIGTSIVLGLGLQTVSNSTAAAVAGRTSDNKNMPRLAAISFLLINGVLTMGSGVGSELLLNKEKLAEIQASKAADEYLEALEEAANGARSQYYSDYIKLEQQCESLGKELVKAREKYGENDPVPRQIYRDIKGDFKDRDILNDKYPSSTPPNETGNFPICPKKEAYKNAVFEDRVTQNSKVDFDRMLGQRIESGNDVNFLKQNALPIHQTILTENGEIKNGSLAVESALENLLDKTFDLNLKELGFPLFLFLISSILSIAACGFVYYISCRPDALDSHSDIAVNEINNWMDDKWKQLRNKQRYNSFATNDLEGDEEERQLFNDFRHFIAEHGLKSSADSDNNLLNATQTALEKQYSEHNFNNNSTLD